MMDYVVLGVLAVVVVADFWRQSLNVKSMRLLNTRIDAAWSEIQKLTSSHKDKLLAVDSRLKVSEQCREDVLRALATSRADLDDLQKTVSTLLTRVQALQAEQVVLPPTSASPSLVVEAASLPPAEAGKPAAKPPAKRAAKKAAK